MRRPTRRWSKDLTALMDQLLGVVAAKTSAADPSYYDEGQWHFSNDLIACQGGPALWRQSSGVGGSASASDGR